MKITFKSVLVMGAVILSTGVGAQTAKKRMAYADSGNNIYTFNETNGKLHEYIETNWNGDHYEMKLVNGKPTMLNVNDKRISPAGYGKYSKVIAEIREQIQEDRDQAKRDRAQARLDQQQAQRDQQQAKRDQEQAARDQIQAKRQQEEAARDQQQAQRDQEQAARDQEQAKLDQEQAGRDQIQAKHDQEAAEEDQRSGKRWHCA